MKVPGMVTVSKDWVDDGSVPIQKYIEASRKLDVSGISWDRVRDYPLDALAIKSLIFMSDIEGYTIRYVRDLLNTAAIHEPDLGRFMTLWSYEELFHQEALSRFLSEYGCAVGRERISYLIKNTARSDRLMMAAASLMSYVTRDFLAVYMVWGAINELTTQAAYGLLADKCGHPILAELLRRIMKDEWRHFSFYYQQARRRLERPRALWLAPRIVKRFWRPVGNGIHPVGDTYQVNAYLFDCPEGRRAFREVDQRISRLPGFEWFHMCENYSDELDSVRGKYD